eukprot:Em1008g2a
MSETFQSLSLAMSSPDKTDPRYLELAHSVVVVIKKAYQEFCPHLEVFEVISCPPEASSDHSDDTQRKKYVVIEEWTKKDVEPCLSYLVGVSPSMVPSFSSTCNLKDLMNDIASKIPAKWRSVGIQLGLSSGTLTVFKVIMQENHRHALTHLSKYSLPGRNKAPVHTTGML